MNLLGLDVGFKNTGIALCEKNTKIAIPLKVVDTCNIENELSQFIKSYNIKKIIYGYPFSLSGKESSVGNQIENIMDKLKKVFNKIEFYFVDERFTTNIANKLIDNDYYHKPLKNKKSTKTKIKKRKLLKDKISAALILQTYVDKNENI